MMFAIHVGDGDVDEQWEFHGELMPEFSFPEAGCLGEAEQSVYYWMRRLGPDFGGLLVLAFDSDGDGTVVAYGAVPKLARVRR